MFNRLQFLLFPNTFLDGPTDESSYRSQDLQSFQNSQSLEEIGHELKYLVYIRMS